MSLTASHPRSTGGGRWSAWVWVDFALAGLLVVGAELELRYTAGEPSWRGLGHALVMFPQILPVAVRRLRPSLAGTLGLVGLLVEDLFIGPTNTASELLAAILLMYAVGRWVDGRRLAGVLGLLTLVVVYHSLQLDRHEYEEPSDSEFLIDLAFSAAVIGGAVAVGRFIRGREQEKDTAVETAVADERARIARELHDVVAHGMGVMVVQAAAAEQLLATDPAAAVRPLTTVRATGQDALAEMRRLLGLLRDGADESALPQPGLPDLPALVERTGERGLSVTYVVTGEPIAVGTGLGLSAYRIVQEALTNVLRHAGPVPTTVSVVWEPGVLRLRIHNRPGSATSSQDGAGHGLVGMRERARLYDGRVDAGPRPDGSFLVEATLPVGPVRPVGR